MSKEILFKVRFEDKTEKMLTAREIDNLNDKRRWVVLDKSGKVILAKRFKG